MTCKCGANMIKVIEDEHKGVFYYCAECGSLHYKREKTSYWIVPTKSRIV